MMKAGVIAPFIYKAKYMKKWTEGQKAKGHHSLCHAFRVRVLCGHASPTGEREGRSSLLFSHAQGFYVEASLITSLGERSYEINLR